MEAIEKVEKIITKSSLEEWNLNLLNEHIIELKNLNNNSISGNLLQMLILYRSQLNTKILKKILIKQNFNWESLFQIELNIIYLIHNILNNPKLIGSSYFFYSYLELLLFTIKFGFDAEKIFKDLNIGVPNSILDYTNLLKTISTLLKSSEMDNLIELSEGTLSDLKVNFEGLCLITNVYIELIPLTSYYSAKLAPTYLGLKHCLSMLSEIEDWDYNELQFIDLILNIGYQIHEETPHSTTDQQTKKRDLNILSHHIAHLVVFIRDFKHLYWELITKLISNKYNQITREFPIWIKDIIGYALENTYYQLNGNEIQEPQSTLHLRIKKLASIVLLPPTNLNPHLYLEVLTNFINSKATYHHSSLASLYIIKALLESSTDNFSEELSYWNPIKIICELIDNSPQDYSIYKDNNYDSGKLIDLYDPIHWSNLLSNWIINNPNTLRVTFISSLELIYSVDDRGWELILSTWSKVFSNLPDYYQIQIFNEVLKLTPNFWSNSANINRLQLLINEFSRIFNSDQKLLIGTRLKKYISLVLTKQSQEALMIVSIFPLNNLCLNVLNIDQDLICDLLNWLFTNIQLFLTTQEHFNLLTKALINLNLIKFDNDKDSDDDSEVLTILRKFDKQILEYVLLYAPDSKYMMYGDGQILVQGANYFHSIKNLSDSKSIDLLNNISQWLEFEPNLLNEFVFLKLTLKLLTKNTKNSSYKSQSLFYSKKIVESYILIDDWAHQLYVLYNIYITGIIGHKNIMLQLIPSNFKLNLVNFLKSVAKPNESIIEELKEFEYNQAKEKENPNTITNLNCSNWFKLNPIINYPQLSSVEYSIDNLSNYLVNTHKLEKLLEYLNLSGEDSNGDYYKEKLKLPLKRLKTKLN